MEPTDEFVDAPKRVVTELIHLLGCNPIGVNIEAGKIAQLDDEKIRKVVGGDERVHVAS